MNAYPGGGQWKGSEAERQRNQGEDGRVDQGNERDMKGRSGCLDAWMLVSLSLVAHPAGM